MNENNKKEDMCRIPVEATYQIIDGEPVMVSAEWRDIPARKIAEFIIKKRGITPILEGNFNE